MGKYWLLIATLTAGFGAPAEDLEARITALGGKLLRDPAHRIVAVNLRGSWVDDVDLIDLARLPYLERLDLSHTRITDEGMLYLKTAPSIRELNLYYAEQITDQGMNAIRGWKKLRKLNVRGTRIANGTLEIVSHMPQLESLDVANTQITDNGMDLLIALPNLTELSLGRSRVGEGDFGFLRMLPKLTYLDLSGARPVPPDMGGARRNRSVGGMPPNTVRALAELKNLHVLKLGFSGISVEDLKTLRVLENLEKLGLEECPRIDDNAAAELAHWKSLRYVDLQETMVTAKGLSLLRAAKPKLVILTGPSAPASSKPEANRDRVAP